MTRAEALHVVVPDGVDDVRVPSGGNTYDLRLCRGLAARGYDVRLREVPGAWPTADATARRAVEAALATMAGGSVVLVDGLVASAAPEIMVPAARRLRVVVLLHMPVGGFAGLPGTSSSFRSSPDECAVLTAAAAVVTTSAWCRAWLLAAYGLSPARVRAAPPGVDVAEPAPASETGAGETGGGETGESETGGSETGGNLLCVAAVTRGKGHDLLVEALGEVADLPWSCVCVGSLTRDPSFVRELRGRLTGARLGDRVLLVGPRTGAALSRAYAEADLLVLASRAETYGMVVTEALARAVPVLATDVGGVPEALGTTADGRRPGLLAPPGDVGALATLLRCWLDDARLRAGLRDAARERRTGLGSWDDTIDCVLGVLNEVATA